MARFFLDANIFLYAIGGESPHRQSCRKLLAAAGDGTLDAVTSSEVLQEILHVRARHVGIKDAATAVRAAAGMVSEVISVTGEDVLVACTVLEGHPRLSTRDAVHVAVMNNADLRLLVSIDADFDAVKTLKRLSPGDALRLIA